MEKQNQIDSNNKTYLQNIKNLLSIYLYHILISLKIILSSFLNRLICTFSPEKSIKNQIVLITGSGGYLGRNLALEFAKRDATLVLWDINENANSQTVKEIQNKGFFKVHSFKVDLTDRKAIKSTAERIRSTIGQVSIVLMAAAPAFEAKSIMDTSYEQDIEMHFKISYLSQLWLIQEFLQPMIDQNSGHFLTVSSNSALIDMPLISSYASFKLAQTKLIETLREELIFNGIDGIKTTIAYPSVLKGGIADGFGDSYEMDKDVYVSGADAAKKITSAVLKNKDAVYIPSIHGYLYIIKPLFSSRLLGKLVASKVKINPKYLRLKPKKS